MHSYLAIGFIQGIFCRPFLPSVLIIEGVGGVGGGVGLGGRMQKPLFGTPYEQP